MGKKYNWAGALQSQYLKVTDSTPLDDRSVVESRNDLLNENTWVVENTRCTYSGMIAAVVDDPIEDNNGIYYLRRSSKYNKQSWDSTLENYNIEGWRKLSSGSGGNLSNILWITFTKSTHTNGSMTCSATYSEITTAINSGYLVIGMYQPNVQGYYKQYFTIPTNINVDTLLFANQSPNDANEVLFITMTAQEITLTITKDYAIPDVANNDGKVLTADSSNDQVVWVTPSVPVVPTIRTMNHEQLTDSSLGDINIHDGYYFPNAVQDADGNWYGAVVIGDQVWLGENFRSTKLPNGTPITNGSPSANNDNVNFSTNEPRYYVPNDDDKCIETVGLRYNGKAIFNGDNTSTLNPSGVQGFAPSGWHIPSKAEFMQLFSYVTSQNRYLSASPYNQQNPNFNTYQTNALSNDQVWGYESDVPINIVGDQDKINATGFSWKVYSDAEALIDPGYLVTSDFDDTVTTPGTEIISMCANAGGIEVSANITALSDQTWTQYGVGVRFISDLNPIQFRNWYVKTYGTMQHHLMDDKEEVFWCHFNRANKVITQMDKTIDEIYQAYTEGKLIMCESLAASDSQFYSLVSCSQNTIVFGCALSQEVLPAAKFHLVIGTKVSNADTWVDEYVEYQAKLISGVTIKTINGNSILGNGNLTIQSVPTPTSSDEGKLLSVDSNGGYELITIVNSENIEY